MPATWFVTKPQVVQPGHHAQILDVGIVGHPFGRVEHHVDICEPGVLRHQFGSRAGDEESPVVIGMHARGHRRCVEEFASLVDTILLQQRLRETGSCWKVAGVRLHDRAQHLLALVCSALGTECSGKVRANRWVVGQTLDEESTLSLGLDVVPPIHRGERCTTGVGEFTFGQRFRCIFGDLVQEDLAPLTSLPDANGLTGLACSEFLELLERGEALRLRSLGAECDGFELLDGRGRVDAASLELLATAARARVVPGYAHGRRVATPPDTARHYSCMVTSRPNTDDLAELRAENVALRRERDELRGLLGMEPELRDAHRAMTNGSLLNDAVVERFASVDARSPVAEKVALFRSLFAGREDVFAQRWTNEQTGKSGYSPAVQRGARVRDAVRAGGARLLLPMTDSVIERHLRGQAVVGIYSMLFGDTCRLLACDFDDGDWALDALAYVRACAAAQVPVALERSRSGDGAHAWTFFSDAVPATSARRLGMQLLRAAMDERCELDLASYDRLFPSQDHMPSGGFGNLIALPLQRAARASGNSEFLDPATLKPWPDQWRFLSSATRLDRAGVEERIEYLPPIDVGPEAMHRARHRRRNEPPPPERVACTLGARLSVERPGLPPSLVSALKHAAMLHNPVWHERTKLRLSTHDVPKYVRCYQEDLAHLHLPRGLLDRARTLIEDAGASMKLVDSRPKAARVEHTFALDLSTAQQEAVAALAKHEHGVLVAPPGAGKTRMACALIAERDVPTLVLAHTRPLLDQWRGALADALALKPRQIGQHGGGRKRRTHIVDLSTLQSLARIDDLTDFFDGYGMLVIDECHHIPAATFEQVVRHAPMRYVLGLTATPTRRDGMHDIITMQCGPIRHRMTSADSVRDGETTPEVTIHVHETSLACSDEDRDAPIQQQFATLVDDHDRTLQVCDDIQTALAAGRRCIVLSQWKRHCLAITQDLIERGIDPILLHGQLGARERKRQLERLDTTPPDENLVVVATSQLLGEGFDLPQLDTLFLAFPVAFQGRIVQYAGRLLRPYPGKTEVQIHDYVDAAVPVLAAMHAKRKRAYALLGASRADA